MCTVQKEKGKTMREWIIQAETIGNISDGYWYGDGEEIVRCKDCKFCRVNYRYGSNVYCLYGLGIYNLEGFCSLGERKDDGMDS